MTTLHSDRIAVADPKAAQEELGRRKQMLPQVSSAYIPTGRCPLIGMARMGVAPILGGVLAAVAASIAFVFAWASTFWLYAYWDKHSSSVNIIVLLASLITGASLVLVAFCVAGIVPALIVERAGRSGKNRSPRWAALFAIVGATIAVAILFAAASHPFLEAQSAILDRFDPFNLKALRGTSPVFAVLGLLVAAGTAGALAAKKVREQKFCERCETLMSGTAVVRMSWEGGVSIRGTSKERIALTVSEAVGASPGSNVASTLVSCPHCRSGFLESHACFWAYWGGQKPGQLHEDWLYDSKDVDAEQVVLLERIAATASNVT